MGRYRRGDEIWSIDCEGTRVVIVEPDGTKRVEELASPAMARTRFNVLVNQRQRGGWTLFKEEAVASAPPAPPPRIVEGARNPSLEAAIVAEPHAVEPWFVYGDWLEQQGDPRGMHIALKRAVRAAPDDLVAKDRLRRFELFHARYLGGEIEMGKLGWGFLESVEVKGPRDLEQVFASDAARLLRRIEIADTSTKKLAGALEVIGRAAPPTLCELSVDGEMRLASIVSIGAVLGRAARLELTCVLDVTCVSELATTPLPALRVLMLACGDAKGRDRDRERAREMRRAVLALLERADLAVHELHLDIDPSPEIVEAIANAQFARELHALTLARLDDEMARVLIAAMGRLPKLKGFAASTSDLSDDMHVAFEAATGGAVSPSVRLVSLYE